MEKRQRKRLRAFRLGLCAGVLLWSFAACRATETTLTPALTVTPNGAPLRVELLPLSVGVDSVHVALEALLRNTFADTLTIETTCGVDGLRLEYADGTHWRPVVKGTVSRACILMYTEMRVAPGDSALLRGEAYGTRAARDFGLRWVAPPQARYRLVASATRCMRHGRRDCRVSLVSEPFSAYR